MTVQAVNILRQAPDESDTNLWLSNVAHRWRATWRLSIVEE